MFGKEIWASLLLLSLLAVLTAEGRIFKGKTVSADDLLNVVKLQIFYRNPKREYECTGTIISKHHVLTVAHCLHNNAYIEGEEPQYVLVFTRDEKKSVFVGRHWKMHSLYSSSNNVNDIAIITVKETMEIPPALLAVNYAPNGDLLRVAAYDKDVLVDSYAEGHFKENCSFSDAYKNVKGICMYDPKTGISSGDHGSPLFALGKDDKYYQVGINLLVRVKFNGRSAFLSNDVSHYCPWIEETTEDKVNCQRFKPTKIVPKF